MRTEGHLYRRMTRVNKQWGLHGSIWNHFCRDSNLAKLLNRFWQTQRCTFKLISASEPACSCKCPQGKDKQVLPVDCKLRSCPGIGFYNAQNLLIWLHGKPAAKQFFPGNEPGFDSQFLVPKVHLVSSQYLLMHVFSRSSNFSY